MLRYFVAANFWLAVALCLVLGSDYARTSPNRYNVFGFGWIEPWVYQSSVALVGFAAIFNTWAWAKSAPRLACPPRKPAPDDFAG